MNFDDNKIKLLYKDDVFYLDTKYLYIDTKIKKSKNDIEAWIYSLILKDFDLQLQGNVQGNIKDKKVLFGGRFSSHGIDGDVILLLENDILNYAINTDKFTSLKGFMDALVKKTKLSHDIGDWIYKKIVAKEYKIEFLEGKIDIKNKKFFPNQIKAKGRAKKASIKLNDEVEPILVEHVNVELKNDTLYFESPMGIYEGLEVKEPRVHIYNVLSNGAGAVVRLNSDIPLNEDVLKILKSYKINIPIIQTSGLTNTFLNLDLGFENMDLKANGIFKINPSKVQINGIEFFTNKGILELDGTKMIFTDVNLQYKDVFNINSSGILDINTLQYKGNANIKKLNINFEDQNFLDAKNENIPIFMENKGGNFQIDLPKYEIKLNFSKHLNTIIASNLSLIHPNSPFMIKNGIKDGNLSLKTKDFKDYNIRANITKMKPFLEKNGKKIGHLNLNIKTSPYLNIKEKNNAFELKNINGVNVANIKDHNLLIHTNKIKTTTQNNKKFLIKGQNSNIILEDLNKSILCDSYTIDLSQKTVLDLTHMQGDLNFEQEKNKLILKAKKLNSKFINTYLGKEIFKEGKFFLKLTGANFDNLMGVLHMENTFVKSFSFYNNLIAFINSIPSLMAFQQLSFSQKGYSIKSADILFSKLNDTIQIKAINIRGIDADILGKGTINLKDNSINMDLKLKTFKGVSNFINKIPLVNHILLGKDRSIQTAIKATGTLENPIIQTTTIKDILTIPFDIIRRTMGISF
ncbi:MAG: hypothetical protein CR967_04775 [Proteobacteria bacterium]|nr:MAG: hypothetical protein CR967_04775 [Pseudomonadota bacterium]